MINSTWTGGTTYLNGINTYKGVYTPSNTLIYGTSPPLTVYQSGFGSTYIGFILLNVPNHYRLQVRTHASLIGGTSCTWFAFTLDWGSGSVALNYTDP